MVTPQQPTTNRTTYRVIYGDTDQMGVVYYANYLRWFEKGRSEWLRQIGRPYAGIESLGLHFPVVDVHCKYFQSAHYDDVIVIETTLNVVNRASLVFTYRILREADQYMLAEGTTKHACVDHSGKLMRLPQELVDALGAGSAT